MDPVTLRAHLLLLLDSADPIHQAHARWRLDLLDRNVPAPPPPSHDPSKREEIRKTARLHRRARSCPHRTHLGGCGCKGWCALGRGEETTDSASGEARHVVDLADCLACPELPGAASDAH